MKTTETHVYFYDGPFSNWYSCTFADHIHPEIAYYNTEQAFMWHKANFFNDKKIAKQIASESSPSQVKKLGRQIRGFDTVSWDCVKFGFMVYVNYLKFSQNHGLRTLLIETENKTLAEVSATDQIWGIGLGLENPDIFDSTKWLGSNLLGESLMKVREMIK